MSYEQLLSVSFPFVIFKPLDENNHPGVFELVKTSLVRLHCLKSYAKRVSPTYPHKRKRENFQAETFPWDINKQQS